MKGERKARPPAAATTTATTAATIARLLAEGAARLRAAGVTDPRREAGSLLAHATGRERTYLLTHPEALLAPAEAERFGAALARRAAREPLQYITGHQEFFGLDFTVTPAVLIPRPETELLVETALALCGARGGLRLGEVGVGSGCVIVTLLHRLPAARGTGVDLSPAALRVADENARRHEVRPRLDLLAADGLSALSPAPLFDLLVSNPPYIAERELPALQPEVRDYEPRAALTPGGDGLSLIRHLLAEAPFHLAPGGHLLFEIGFGQRASVERLVDESVWTDLGVRPDLQGIPRVVTLRLKEL